MVVNYHITPDIVYGCVLHRYLLSIGEHTHLDAAAFGEFDMQEANKGLHSVDYYFGYPYSTHRLQFEDRLSHAIKERRSK